VNLFLHEYCYYAFNFGPAHIFAVAFLAEEDSLILEEVQATQLMGKLDLVNTGISLLYQSAKKYYEWGDMKCI
jgi:hypothetical protein